MYVGAWQAVFPAFQSTFGMQRKYPMWISRRSRERKLASKISRNLRRQTSWHRVSMMQMFQTNRLVFQEIVGKIKYNGTEFSCTKTQIIIITVTYTRTFFRKILTRSSKCRFLLGYTTFSSRYNSREESLFPVLKASRRALLREERRSRHA